MLCCTVRVCVCVFGLAFSIAVIHNFFVYGICQFNIHSFHVRVYECFFILFGFYLLLVKRLNVCCLTPCYCCFFLLLLLQLLLLLFSMSLFQISVNVQWQQLNDIIQCFVIIKNRLVLKSEMLISTIALRLISTTIFIRLPLSRTIMANSHEISSH